MKDEATCRGCNRKLFGRNYCYGGDAYIPRPDGTPGPRAKINYYGGYVCSRSCDYKSSLKLEQSMPGHGYSQRSLSPNSPAAQRVEANWGERQ